MCLSNHLYFLQISFQIGNLANTRNIFYANDFNIPRLYIKNHGKGAWAGEGVKIGGGRQP